MSVRRCKVYLFDEEEDSEGVQRKNPEVIFEQNKNVKEKGKRSLIEKRWKWVSLGLVRVRNQRDKDEGGGEQIHSRERTKLKK